VPPAVKLPAVAPHLRAEGGEDGEEGREGGGQGAAEAGLDGAAELDGGEGVHARGRREGSVVRDRRAADVLREGPQPLPEGRRIVGRRGVGRGGRGWG